MSDQIHSEPGELPSDRHTAEVCPCCNERQACSYYPALVCDECLTRLYDEATASGEDTQ